jgi:hypothetical protein
MTKAVRLKDRVSVATLLEDHQKIEDALEYGPKPKFSSYANVFNEDGESFEVPLQWAVAKSALIAQRTVIEKELEKLGVTLTG